MAWSESEPLQQREQQQWSEKDPIEGEAFAHEQLAEKGPTDRQILHIEEQLRGRVSQACRLAERLECELKQVPLGQLGELENSYRRGTLAILSAEVVSDLNNTLKLLISISPAPPPSLMSPPTPPQQALNLPGASPPRVRPHVLVEVDTATEKASFPPDAVPVVHHGTMPNTTPHTPHLLSHPHSSPPLYHIGTSSPTASDISAYSASEISRLQTVNEEERKDTSCHKAANTKKRKPLEKYSTKEPAIFLDNGQEVPPHDGYSWRKYGQKRILYTSCPRQYYKCSHKSDVGCPALKQVQKCSEGSPFFNITYRGCHTCRSRPYPSVFPYPSNPFSIDQMLSHPNAASDSHLIANDSDHLQSPNNHHHGTAASESLSIANDSNHPQSPNNHHHPNQMISNAIGQPLDSLAGPSMLRIRDAGTVALGSHGSSCAPVVGNGFRNQYFTHGKRLQMEEETVMVPSQSSRKENEGSNRSWEGLSVVERKDKEGEGEEESWSGTLKRRRHGFMVPSTPGGAIGTPTSANSSLQRPTGEQPTADAEEEPLIHCVGPAISASSSLDSFDSADLMAYFEYMDQGN